MKIERFNPKPPAEFKMTFARDDGWAIVAALREYVERHQGAAHLEDWKKWAADLDRELRVY